MRPEFAMRYDSHNVFARILRGELPSERIYADADAIVFMDLMPQAVGHCLVVPREAAATLLDLSPESAAACIRVTQRIARAVQSAFNAPGILIVQTNGAEAGQTVPHVHFHVIPRYPGDGLKMHAMAKAEADQLRLAAQKIRSCLL